MNGSIYPFGLAHDEADAARFAQPFDALDLDIAPAALVPGANLPLPAIPLRQRRLALGAVAGFGHVLGDDEMQGAVEDGGPGDPAGGLADFSAGLGEFERG